MTNKQFRKELKESIANVKKGDYPRSIYSNKIWIDKFFTENDYIQIKGLYDFITKFNETPSHRIEELIIENGEIFTFLNKFISSKEDMIDEMREHGLKYACLACRNSNVLEYNRKVVEQREQALGR